LTFVELTILAFWALPILVLHVVLLLTYSDNVRVRIVPGVDCPFPNHPFPKSIYPTVIASPVSRTMVGETSFPVKITGCARTLRLARTMLMNGILKWIPPQ
jgi:hypothetical protein